MTTPPRLALVGSSSVLGGDLKDLLSTTGYPGRMVELLDLDDQIGLITKYGDEARVTLEVGAESLREHQLVCFCGDNTAAQRFAPVVVAAGGTVIDCTRAHDSAADVTLLNTDGSPEANGLLVVPQAGTLLLATLAGALGKRFVSAVVTVLLPASEFSDAGTQELASQAAALLSLSDSPQESFGRRLAFDAWLDATPPVGAAEAIRQQLDHLSVLAPAVNTLRVSVFHATGASIYLPGTSTEELRGALRQAGVRVDATNPAGETIDSPARVSGCSELHVCGIREEAGGSWLWALLDNHHAAAGAALTAIKSRLPLPEPAAG